MYSSVSTGYKRTPAPGDAFNLCHRQDRMTKLMASTEHPVDACLEPTSATGYGPRAQCREPGTVTRPALFRVRHSPSEHHDTRLTTEGSKIVDTKSVHKPRVHVFKAPLNLQPQCTLHSAHAPIDHEPANLDVTDTHYTHIQTPASRSGSHGIRHASIRAFPHTKPLLDATSQTHAVVRVHHSALYQSGS